MSLKTDAEPRSRERCAYVYHRGQDGESVCLRERASVYHYPHAGDGHCGSLCSHHPFVSRSAAGKAKADTPNSEAPTAGIGAEPATPASAVQASAAENECEACVDLGRPGTEVARYVQLAHEHLRQRIRTLNAIQVERDRACTEVARLRAENERLAEAAADYLEAVGVFETDCSGWDGSFELPEWIDVKARKLSALLPVPGARRALTKEAVP